jgi:hypothetical protein
MPGMSGIVHCFQQFNAKKQRFGSVHLKKFYLPFTMEISISFFIGMNSNNEEKYVEHAIFYKIIPKNRQVLTLIVP